jgi:hypothetical protein
MVRIVKVPFKVLVAAKRDPSHFINFVLCAAEQAVPQGAGRDAGHGHKTGMG